MISIVIPLYNSMNYIEKTIRSCLSQSYRDLEIIVVDDCSDDQSAKIVQRIMSEDTRVSYYCNEENLGVIKTINHGLKYCSGYYVIVLGNDDILNEKHIETYLEYIKKKEYSFLYCSSDLIDENGVKFGECKAENIEGHYSKLARYNPINACGVMINYKYLKEVGFYPSNLGFRNCGEWYLWIELLHHENCAYVDEIKSLYRIHSSNLTKKLYSKKYIKETRLYSVMCMKQALQLEGVSTIDKIKYTIFRLAYNLKMQLLTILTH